MLADLPVPGEPQLLVGRQRPVVQEPGGHRVGVLGVSLHGSPAKSGDQVQRAGERGGSHALTPVSLADVTARDPPVRWGRLAFLVGGAALDPRQLPGRAELAPAQAVAAVEDERRMCRSRTHAGQLAVTVQLRRGVLADALGMESHAPAAAEDAVVVLHQRGERRPRRLVERSDTVGGRCHEINVAPDQDHRSRARATLVEASGWRQWPPRLLDQPAFYPVLSEEYATMFARDWNVRHSGSGGT